MTEASRSEYVLLLSRSLVIPDHDDRLSTERCSWHVPRLDCCRRSPMTLTFRACSSARLFGQRHRWRRYAVQLLHDFIHEITLAAASRADRPAHFNAGARRRVERRAAPAGSHDVDRTEFAVWWTLLLSTAVLFNKTSSASRKSSGSCTSRTARGSDIVLFVLKDGGLGHLDFPRGVASTVIATCLDITDKSLSLERVCAVCRRLSPFKIIQSLSL